MADSSLSWQRRMAVAALLAMLSVAAPFTVHAADTGINAQVPRDLVAQAVATDRAQQDEPPAPTEPGTAARNPEPQAPADTRDPGRNVWSTPLSGFAAALGLSGWLARLGLNESVAAAVAGVLLVLPLIVAAFFAWQFVRRRRVLDPDRKAPAFDAHGRGSTR